MASFIEKLPCTLTPSEVRQRGEQLAAKMHEHLRVKADQKAANTTFKAQLEAIDGEMKELATAVSKGEELRPIECHERAQYAQGYVEIIRLDTDALVRTRSMRMEERQSGFKFEGRDVPTAEQLELERVVMQHGETDSGPGDEAAGDAPDDGDDDDDDFDGDDAAEGSSEAAAH